MIRKSNESMKPNVPYVFWQALHVFIVFERGRGVEGMAAVDRVQYHVWRWREDTCPRVYRALPWRRPLP